MPLKLISKQTIFNGKKVRLEVHHLEPDEGGATHTREVCVHPGAVVILAIKEDQTVLMIRTRRYAVGETLLELPAGTLEPGENPMNCAGRELLEETGYLAGRIEPLGKFYTSPGILSEQMYAFAAYDLELQQQALEEGEEIEVCPLPLNRVIDMIRTGDLRDGKSIATFMLYNLRRAGGPAVEVEDGQADQV